MIWILVAHRSSARIFESTGKRGQFRLVNEFEFPEGRRQNREIDTDAHGSRMGSSGGGSSSAGGFGPGYQMKHGLDPHIEAVEHLTNIFAKELAMVLRDGRTHQQFDEAMIVAEPGFLGKIRQFLDKETSRRISGSLNKNLAELPQHEIVRQLESFVLEHRRVA